jgi:hypothetical protein
VSDLGGYEPGLSEDYFCTPNSARIWNFLMGGKDNFTVDRASAEEALEIFPELRTVARRSRAFLIRAVRYLAGEAGIRQFLDIGPGLPNEQNTHQVAHAVAPDSRIVYVDNDPMVLLYARSLLDDEPGHRLVRYVQEDMRNPELVVGQGRQLLDLTQPVAVILSGVLGHVVDYDESVTIVRTVMDALPSGSYLVQQDGTDTDGDNVVAHDKYNGTGGPAYLLRSPELMCRYFDGLELLEPGYVPITQWRPPLTVVGGEQPRPIPQYGGIGRKP